MPKNCTSVRKWNNSLTSFNNLQAPATSWEVRGLSPSIFVVSFSFRSLICLCIVIFRLRWENCTSISFFGFKDLCQYLKLEMLKCTTLLQLFYVCRFNSPASTHRSWQNNSGSIYGLKDALTINSSCDLSDQNWCQSFWPKFFVHTQEINFHHLFQDIVDSNVCRDSRYKPY